MANIDQGKQDCKEITKTSMTHLTGAANLDRDKMLGEAWWLEYCCCTGVAIGDVGNPYFAAESRNLCIHETCECTSVGDPFCSNIEVMCCITSQCAFPPIEGSPTCACCSKVLAGKDKVGNWKPKLIGYEFAFDQTFWVYYLFCGGWGFNGCQANGRPILGASLKQLCIKEEQRCTAPIQGGVLCSGIGTQLCCWKQMQFPKTEKAPWAACCGMVLAGPKQEKKASPMGYGKPTQVEMK